MASAKQANFPSCWTQSWGSSIVERKRRRSMPSYSLLTCPWIPVQTIEGRNRSVGLYEALNQAHTLRGIEDSSPLVTVSLHRLLLALVHCTHGPIPNADAWDRLWRAGHFDEQAVARYIEKLAD